MCFLLFVPSASLSYGASQGEGTARRPSQMLPVDLRPSIIPNYEPNILLMSINYLAFGVLLQ